jgi:hypothetical protein
VCSSIIEAILIALPSMVESNWKSIAHTTFGASAGSEAPRTPRHVYAARSPSPAAPLRARAGGPSFC